MVARQMVMTTFSLGVSGLYAAQGCRGLVQRVRPVHDRLEPSGLDELLQNDQIMSSPWGLAPTLVRRFGQTEQAERARTLYGRLVDQIRSDRYRVENYRFPLMADERRVGSTLLQRLLGDGGAVAAEADGGQVVHR